MQFKWRVEEYCLRLAMENRLWWYPKLYLVKTYMHLRIHCEGFWGLDEVSVSIQGHNNLDNVKQRYGELKEIQKCIVF